MSTSCNSASLYKVNKGWNAHTIVQGTICDDYNYGQFVLASVHSVSWVNVSVVKVT